MNGVRHGSSTKFETHQRVRGGGGGVAFGVLLGILGVGRDMLPGSPNPDPI